MIPMHIKVMRLPLFLALAVAVSVRSTFLSEQTEQLEQVGQPGWLGQVGRIEQVERPG